MAGDGIGRKIRGKRVHARVHGRANRIRWASLGRRGRGGGGGGCRMFNRTGRVQCSERLSALDIPSVST